MNTMTKETLIDAFQKSKATTITGVWRYLGHKSAISGRQTSQIRKLVPNYMELLKSNQNATNIKAEKTPTTGQVPTVVTPPVVTPPVASQVEKTTNKKPKGAGGFRNGSNYSVLFAEGNKDFIALNELVDKVAKLTNRTEKLVMFDYYVMCNTQHKSNGGRAKVEEKDGKIRIVSAC